MKKILTTTIFFLFLFLLHTSTSFAATYYISSTDGDDTCTGLSQTAYTTGLTACPIKTLTKLNTKTFSPGDSILFKKGDTFYGSITVSQSGTAGNPITFSSYGSGEKPIITGFTDVTSWTNLGNNIWESTSPVSTLSTLNMVTINNVNTAMGRWPNADNTNTKGYLTYQTSTPTSVTSSSLTGAPNWTGAEVIVKSTNFSIERRIVTSQSGGTLNWVTNASRGPSNGFGFFIQNDPKTLDQQNEWYYNPSTNKLSIYSTSQPTNVKIASVAKLISVNRNYVTIDGLGFTGANEYAIWNDTSSAKTNITLTNNDISFVGTSGITLRGNYLDINNNVITYSNGSAIGTPNSGYSTIGNNIISNTGLFAGMGVGHSSVGLGYSSNMTMEGNSITNVGFNGISFQGINVTIRNNFIDTFCQEMDDGGGIYTYTGNQYPSMENVLIENNVIINGIGAPQGTDLVFPAITAGIYLDNKSKNVEISGNSLLNNRKYGLYFNDSSYVNAHNNIIFGTWETATNKYSSQFKINHSWDSLSFLSNFIINNNIFFSKKNNQYTFELNSPINNILNFGTANNNIYARPIDDNKTILADQPDQWSGAREYKTFAEWQTFSSQDLNSKKSPISITSESDIFFDYATSSSKTVTLPWPVVDMDGVKHTGNVTITPYSSVIYLKDPNPTPTITTYTLTYTANSNGTITGSSPQTVNSGSSGTAVTAVPSTGYQFTSWSDSSTSNPRTDTNVTSNKTVSATFTLTPVTPSGGGGGGGSSTPSTPSLTETQLKAKSKDIKQDGHLNIIDFNIIMANWNKAYTTNSLSKGDMTGDGKIDIFDINQLMVYWDVKYML